MFLKNLKNVKGLSLMEVLFALAVVGGMTFATTSSLHFTKKIQKDNIKTSHILNLIRDLKERLRVRGALAGSLDCVHNQTAPVGQRGCYSGLPEKEFYRLLNNASAPATTANIYYDSNSNNGFNKDGKVCTGYPSKDCFIKARFFVKYHCYKRDQVAHNRHVTQDCTHPEIKIKVKFAFDDGTRSPASPPASPSPYDFVTFADNEAIPCLIDCREVNFTYNSGSSPFTRPTLNVFFIVDNSNSMSVYQEKLAQAIGGLIDKFQSLNTQIQFYVYTTDQTENVNTSSVSYSKKCRYWDSAAGTWKTFIDASGNPLKCPINSIFHRVQLALIQKGVNKGKETTVLSLADPSKITSLQQDPTVLHMSPGTTNFTALKNALKQVITKAGTRGSSQEYGKCTIARIMAHRESINGHKLFAGTTPLFKQGDKAIFIVISDENDASRNNTNDLSSCPIERKQTISCNSVNGWEQAFCKDIHNRTPGDCPYRLGEAKVNFADGKNYKQIIRLNCVSRRTVDSNPFTTLLPDRFYKNFPDPGAVRMMSSLPPGVSVRNMVNCPQDPMASFYWSNSNWTFFDRFCQYIDSSHTNSSNHFDPSFDPNPSGLDQTNDSNYSNFCQTYYEHRGNVWFNINASLVPGPGEYASCQDLPSAPVPPSYSFPGGVKDHFHTRSPGLFGLRSYISLANLIINGYRYSANHSSPVISGTCKIKAQSESRFYPTQCKRDTPPTSVLFNSLSAPNSPAHFTTLTEVIKGFGDFYFGPKGYFISSIINDSTIKIIGANGSTTSCSWNSATGQSEGKEYKKLASLGLGGSIACIGSRDYTGALSQISTLVSQIINNSFTYANLGPNEVIVGIQVTDSSGHTRTYNGTGGIISINGNTIQVNPGYTILHTGDQVKIMIETRYASRRTFF